MFRGVHCKSCDGLGPGDCVVLACPLSLLYFQVFLSLWVETPISSVIAATCFCLYKPWWIQYGSLFLLISLLGCFSGLLIPVFSKPGEKEHPFLMTGVTVCPAQRHKIISTGTILILTFIFINSDCEFVIE